MTNIAVLPVQRLFAFFSLSRHEDQNGLGVMNFTDTASGKILRANYLGAYIAGYPGHFDGEKIIRPAHFETFVCIGELGEGKLQFINPEKPEEHFSEDLAEEDTNQLLESLLALSHASKRRPGFEDYPRLVT